MATEERQDKYTGNTKIRRVSVTLQKMRLVQLRKS